MVLDDKLLIMEDGPKIDLEEVCPHTQVAMSKELEDERLKGQRSEIEKRILQQKCIELERQMKQTNEIAAIRVKQIEDLQKQLEEKEARHDLDSSVEMEDNTQEECDHKDCEHIKCTACDHHMDTNDELVEHHGVCHCNPQSPLFGKQA
ncbi:uncharacterized protein [Antedon mediterranea]|uniref:uncharacterized protein n=1 Tax=Antedon mediterranea TaxID=105859 RepID=UPI003AF4A421